MRYAQWSRRKPIRNQSSVKTATLWDVPARSWVAHYAQYWNKKRDEHKFLRHYNLFIFLCSTADNRNKRGRSEWCRSALASTVCCSYKQSKVQKKWDKSSIGSSLMIIFRVPLQCLQLEAHGISKALYPQLCVLCTFSTMLYLWQVAKLSRSLQAEKMDLTDIGPLVDAQVVVSSFSIFVPKKLPADSSDLLHYWEDSMDILLL